jgi:hypothetical protein
VTGGETSVGHSRSKPQPEGGKEDMKRLLIVTDLGTFKAFRMEEDRFSTRPKLELVQSFELVDGHDKISKKVSDSAGQFGKGARNVAGANDASTADNHGLILEDRRRNMREIADHISKLLGNGEFDSCFFAAASEINQKILDQVPRSARDKIEKNIPCNLTHADRDELMRHFEN